MASLLDLGADLQSVRQAVESVGCRLPEEERHRSLPGGGDLGQELPVLKAMRKQKGPRECRSRPHTSCPTQRAGCMA